ncbi:MAG: beta family protein [Cohaesibacter sp.]|jgi:hypothetical protein|nr:beta family protein [Cohaesibacter sp.]
MTYHLLIKTADAEFRAWKMLSDERKKKISVHCEITRGRKKPNKDKSAPAEYNISKVLDRIKNEFKQSRECVVDLTREETLASTETEWLSQSNEGYRNWVSIVNELSRENDQIRPTILINPGPEDSFEEFRDSLFQQFDSFAKEYDLIAYRASVLHDGGFIDDLEILSDRINKYCADGNTFRLILDFEYIRPQTAELHASYAVNLVREARKVTPDIQIVSVGTSFPKNVTDIGGEENDEFSLEEVALHRALTRLQNTPIEYGDYGSINPIRNDVAPPVGVYLRARIDFPTENNTIVYHRVEPIVDPDSKKLLTSRSSMYKRAAKLLVADERFSLVSDCWGYGEIKHASESVPSGSSPSFWISVRMEIHICRRLDHIMGPASDLLS